MKVMIPASGGLDSTTLLWEVLTTTAHEVVAVHYDEGWLPVRFPEREARAEEAFDAVCAWLRSEAREFETRRGPAVDTDSSGAPLPDGERPVRPGFAQTEPVSWHYEIFATHGHYAGETGADEAWVALNTWNRRRDTAWLDIEREVFLDRAGPGPELRYPWLAFRSGVWRGRSRLGNLRRIPAELHALTARCYRDGGPGDCGACISCRARAFHDRWCRGLDDAAFAAVEERIEELACFGRHFGKADPETYRHRFIDAVLQDEHGWREWSEAARPGGE